MLNFIILDQNMNPFLQRLESDRFKADNLQVHVLRLDKIHPEISGNKWFKLKYNLKQAEAKGHKTILTFGGAYSNHIAATAAAGKLFGLKTIGVIRGEEERNNHTLKKATRDGMELLFVSRDEYKKKHESSFAENLKNWYGDFYMIPEGGANDFGVKGCTEILNNLNFDFDYVCCACGTGTTLAGLSLALKKHQKVLGFSALKGGSFLEDEVRKYNEISELSTKIITDYHFGGYAKTNQELISFVKDFETKNNIPLDLVYTGKMVFGIFDLINKNYFPKNKNLLIIHSGGLQGTSPPTPLL